MSAPDITRKQHRATQKRPKVDAAYAAKEGKIGSMYEYHSHNEHFAAMAASMEGRYLVAKKAAEALAARLLTHAKMMPVLDGFIMTPIWVDVRFGKWEEELARPEPMKELGGTHAMWRYSHAVALAANGNVSDAEIERDLFIAEMVAFPPEAMLGEMNKAIDVLGVACQVIDARIAAAQGQGERAIEHWKTAVAIQDSLKLRRASRLVLPGTGIAGRSNACRGEGTRSGRSLSRRSAAESAEPAVAIRLDTSVARAEQRVGCLMGGGAI
jgi:hypothetical protein